MHVGAVDPIISLLDLHFLRPLSSFYQPRTLNISNLYPKIEEPLIGFDLQYICMFFSPELIVFVMVANISLLADTEPVNELQSLH